MDEDRLSNKLGNLKELQAKDHLSSFLFGDTMVPNIRVRLYPPFGYSILHKEYNLTRFNRQKSQLT